MDKNGWSLPTPAKVGIVGVLCFILLAQLGLIPYVPSPMVRIEHAIAEHHKQTAEQHRQTIGPLRLLCKAAYKDNVALQAECER